MSTQVQYNSYDPRAEVQNPPAMTVKEWLLVMLIGIIPVVGLIMLFVWAFGSGTNPNKANYSKAALLWIAIIIGVYAIIAILGLVLFGAIGASMSSSY